MGVVNRSAGSSLNRDDGDGMLDVDSGGSWWNLALGDSNINNIGNNVINICLLVQAVVGDRSCEGQSGAEQSEDT